jgi:hypothetical protein
MTYSDVITLMMTFFILLLTFATSEPERFEQMKITVFGSSGANGLVGERPDGIERDSLMLRVRNRANRLTDRGSEVPPIEKDSPVEAVEKGLSGLENDQAREVVDTFSVVIPGNALASADGDLYDYGEYNMNTLAKMMKSRGYDLTIEISSQNQLNRALACIQFLYHLQGISPDQLSVCHDRFTDLDSEKIRMTLRHYQGSHHGKTSAETAK